MVSRPQFAAVVLLISAFFCVTSGCAPNHPQQFASSFLPPAPRATDTETPLPEPPRLDSNLYLKESPNLVTPVALKHRPTEVEDRVRQADSRFQFGKQLYQQGDAEGARQEFDRAIDILLGTSESAPGRERVEEKLEQLVDTIYRYDVDKLGTGDTAPEVVYDKSPLDGILEMTFPIDPSLKPKVKEELLATVSQLPLEENDSVLGYIHFFSTDRGHRTLVAGLRRAGRYRSLIQRILDEEGVPQELIYLAQAESGFLPRAVSRKRATGMWQFIQGRGREYGLLQTAFTDDRLDPEKATRSAAKHLRDLYSHFGDWYLAIAAYNCGPGNVDKAVIRTGFADYWELKSRNVLPKETMNYVPLILAMTIMAKNAKDYQLDDIETERPVEYDTLNLAAPTNLALIGDAADRALNEIRDLNPALLKTIAPAGYQLRVPKGSASTVLAALESIPAGRRSCWRMHRVEQGETLAVIAKRYHASASSIVSANHTVAAPEAGDLLVIPAAFEAARPVAAKTAAKHRRTRTVASKQPSSTHRRVSSRIVHHRAKAPATRTASLR